MITLPARSRVWLTVRTVAAVWLLVFCLAGVLRAQTENLPPKPDQYVTDQAGVLDSTTIDTLNSELDQYERETSNQILVAIYPSLPPGEDVAQYATYTYNAWDVGQKGKDNGAILFIFVNDHKMFIATGRGLEGALPDATCENIVSQVIRPQLRRGDFDTGVIEGVAAMIAATKGEYHGTGTTVEERKEIRSQDISQWIGIAVVIIIVLISMSSRSYGGPIIFTGGGWSGGYGGGGGWGGGGGFSGGGFSGGGGSSGGGGAGGSW